VSFLGAALITGINTTAVENLFVLETVSSIKVADLLNKARSNSSPLGIYLQLNTSNEESKSGLPVPEASDEALQVATHVLTSCPNLIIRGLMTIGSWDASHDDAKPNPDFDALKKARTALVKALNEKGVQGAPKRETDWELSMGMSADFVKAVKEGSGSVRVGTRIFGERPPRR
jgi:pyridoxal phosphate enzyme (YggS family)